MHTLNQVFLYPVQQQHQGSQPSCIISFDHYISYGVQPPCPPKPHKGGSTDKHNANHSRDHLRAGYRTAA